MNTDLAHCLGLWRTAVLYLIIHLLYNTTELVGGPINLTVLPLPPHSCIHPKGGTPHRHPAAVFTVPVLPAFPINPPIPASTHPPPTDPFPA